MVWGDWRGRARSGNPGWYPEFREENEGLTAGVARSMERCETPRDCRKDPGKHPTQRSKHIFSHQPKLLSRLPLQMQKGLAVPAFPQGPSHVLPDRLGQ